MDFRYTEIHEIHCSILSPPGFVRDTGFRGSGCSQ